jgi:hypothetical protein
MPNLALLILFSVYVFFPLLFFLAPITEMVVAHKLSNRYVRSWVSILCNQHHIFFKTSKDIVGYK